MTFIYHALAVLYTFENVIKCVALCVQSCIRELTYMNILPYI